MTIRGQFEGKPGRDAERKPLQFERDADVVPQTGATCVNVAEEFYLRATARPDWREITRGLAEL